MYHQNMGGLFLCFTKSRMLYHTNQSISFIHLSFRVCPVLGTAKGSLKNNFRTLKGSQLFASKAQHMSVLWLQKWMPFQNLGIKWLRFIDISSNSASTQMSGMRTDLKIRCENCFRLLHARRLSPLTIDHLLIRSSRPGGRSQQVAPILQCSGFIFTLYILFFVDPGACSASIIFFYFGSRSRNICKHVSV